MILLCPVIGDGASKETAFRASIMDDVIPPGGGLVDASYLMLPGGAKCLAFIPETPNPARTKADHLAMRQAASVSPGVTLLSESRDPDLVKVIMDPLAKIELEKETGPLVGTTVEDVIFDACKKTIPDFPKTFIADTDKSDVPVIEVKDKVVGGK